jgi:hypothetical protein
MRERKRLNQHSEWSSRTFRLDSSGYILVGFGAFMTLLFALVPFIPHKDGSSQSPSDFLIIRSISAAFLLPTLYGLLRMLQTRIVATEEGMRWIRPLLQERRVAWNDITDYYTEMRSRAIMSGASGESLTIVSAQGIRRVFMVYSDWDMLKTTIESRALNARAQQWDRLGTRPFDRFPRVFRYWDSRRRSEFIRGAIGLTAIWVGYAIAGWNTVLATAAKIGWQDALPSAIGGSVLLLAFAYIPFRILSDYYEAWKRRHEIITATPELIRYENPGTDEVVESPWREVTDYYYRTRRGGFERDQYALVLHGVDEKQIVWTGFLGDKDLLLAFVKRYAPQPTVTSEAAEEWRAKGANEATGGSNPETWQSGAVGMGGRVFRNRASEFKLSLIMLTGIFMALVGVSVVREWLEPEHGQLIQCLRIVVPTVIFPLTWVWTCYFRTRVGTDDMGITHYTPFGERFLSWFAVADYTDVYDKTSARTARKNISFLSIVTGRDGKRMFFWSTLNGYEELRAEVERYAPPPKTGWKTIPGSRQ